MDINPFSRNVNNNKTKFVKKKYQQHPGIENFRET